MNGAELDRLCINTIRFLAVDAVEKAKSGHPGLPLDAAPMAYVLGNKAPLHLYDLGGWGPKETERLLPASRGGWHKPLDSKRVT
jgi:hypothetical protein